MLAAVLQCLAEGEAQVPAVGLGESSVSSGIQPQPSRATGLGSGLVGLAETFGLALKRMALRDPSGPPNRPSSKTLH